MAKIDARSTVFTRGLNAYGFFTLNTESTEFTRAVPWRRARMIELVRALAKPAHNVDHNLFRARASIARPQSLT